MMKSSQHQASVKYFLNPYAVHFITISHMNMILNDLSMNFRIVFNVFRSSMYTSSIAYGDRKDSSCEFHVHVDSYRKIHDLAAIHIELPC